MALLVAWLLGRCLSKDNAAVSVTLLLCRSLGRSFSRDDTAMPTASSVSLSGTVESAVISLDRVEWSR
jgi:hypothetical protein